MELLRPITGAIICSFLFVTEAWAHPPPFFWMTDLASDRRVGVDMSIGHSDNGLVDAFPVMATSVYADFSVTDSVSIVGRIPFVWLRYSLPATPDQDEWDLELGNAGVGFELAGRSQGRHPTVRYGLEGYVHLPTGGDVLPLSVASLFTTPDAGRYAFDTTTLRLRGGARYEGESLFFQGELGVEHHLVDDAFDTTDLLVGLGAGIMLSHYIAFLGEFSMTTEVRDDDDDRDLLPTLDVGMRYHNPKLMAGLRVYIPLSEAYRDADVLAVALDLGVRF